MLVFNTLDVVVSGSNHAGNNLTLKGWPLTGLDQLRSGVLQQQKPFIQSPQPFHQIQKLAPQQQQFMLAQQTLTSPSASDESRRLRMLVNGRNMGLGKDGPLNSVGDVVANVGSPLQAGGSLLPRGDTDVLYKFKMAQIQQQQQHQQPSNNPQQQRQQQHALSSQQSQSSNFNMHQQDTKIGSAVSVTMDGSMSNSFRGTDQASRNQSGKKRKQPVSSSGPANSSGTANTAGHSPSSAPSTPSTHTPPGDVISMPPMSHNGGSSKLMMFGADNPNTFTSPSNHWDDKDLGLLADMDRFAEDGSLDDNVESFLSHDDTDNRDSVGRDMSKGDVNPVY